MLLVDTGLFLYSMCNARRFFLEAGCLSETPFQWMHHPLSGTDVCFLLATSRTLVLFLLHGGWIGRVSRSHVACISRPSFSSIGRSPMADPSHTSVACIPRLDPKISPRCHVAGGGGTMTSTMDPWGCNCTPRRVSASVAVRLFSTSSLLSQCVWNRGVCLLVRPRDRLPSCTSKPG